MATRDNETKAESYLARAGLWDRVRCHVGDAVEQLGRVEASSTSSTTTSTSTDTPMPGGRLATGSASAGSTSATTCCGRAGSLEPRQPDRNTNAILEHNQLIADDERFVSTIVPTRDGVFVALRVA